MKNVLIVLLESWHVWVGNNTENKVNKNIRFIFFSA